MARSTGDITTATVLFTDVVDSTATRIRLGEEAADALYLRHARLLRAVVRAHRVVFTKSVGDGIMAVFDSATNAFKAAVAIGHAVTAENRRAADAVEVRTGLSSGDVIWTEDDIQGLPPVEAARLAARATGGQILCSELSARLAFGRVGVELKQVGLLELKGLDKPLETWEVMWWQHDPGSHVAFPVWLAHDDLLPFVGRSRELTALDDWLERTRDTPGLAVIGGEAGSGKTRLVAEVVSRALERGDIVLTGRCTEQATRPFQPLSEAIDRLVTHAPTLVLQTEPDAGLSDLIRLTPELGAPPFSLPAPAVSDPDTEYFRLVDAVSRLLSRLSTISPVLLVVDDLQWASEATVRLLLAVLRRLGAGDVHLLASLRDGDDDGRAGASGSLRRLLGLPSVLRVHLGPLAAGEISTALAVASDRLGPDVQPMAERVAHITGGNAFLVTEVVRELATGGSLPALALPETISLFIAARVDRVGPVARELIHVVTCAERVELSVLRHALGLDEAEFVAALEQTLDAGLVVEQVDGSFTMAHELARTAVAAGISTARAGAIHRNLAAALNAVHPTITETRPYVMASHLAAVAAVGDADDVRRALDAARRAAADATVRLAHLEAVDWFERAIALHERLVGEPDDVDVELLLGLGEAQWRSGRREARRTLLDAGRGARALGRGDLLVRAARAGNRGFFSITGNTDDELVQLLTDALDAVEPDAVTVRAELLALLASELTWAPDGDRRFALSDEALELARQSGDHRTIVGVLGLRSLTISAADTVHQRLADSDELLRVAQASGDDLLTFQAVFQRTGPLLDIGDTTGISALLEEAGTLAARLGQPQLQWLVQFSKAGLVLMAGDVDAAEDAAGRALDLGMAAGHRMEALAFYSEQLAEIRRLQDRFHEVVDGMRMAAGHLVVDPVHAVLRYLCEAGTGDDVVALYEQAVGRGLPPRRDLAERAALDNLAFVAVRLGRTDDAAVLYDTLLPYASTFGHSAVAHPCGHHYLGLLAAALDRPETALGHFAAAASCHERAGTPLLLAESVLDWAELLRATGSPDHAVDNVRQRARDALAGRRARALTARLAQTGA